MFENVPGGGQLIHFCKLLCMLRGLPLAPVYLEAHQGRAGGDYDLIRAQIL